MAMIATAMSPPEFPPGCILSTAKVRSRRNSGVDFKLVVGPDQALINTTGPSKIIFADPDSLCRADGIELKSSKKNNNRALAVYK